MVENEWCLKAVAAEFNVPKELLDYRLGHPEEVGKDKYHVHRDVTYVFVCE